MSVRRVRRAGRRRARGFTLVEVLMAMGVMTMGAMALMGFQRHVARSNRYARELATATQVAENWIERLKTDTRYWNLMNGRNQAGWPNEGPMLARTQWLRQTVGAGNQFQTIVLDQTVGTGTPGMWNAADMNGFDMAPDPVDLTHHYCVSFRFAWVYFGSALRADVRVWWVKDIALADPNTALASFRTCTDTDVRLSPGGDLIDLYHVVYMSTVLRRSEQDPGPP